LIGAIHSFLFRSITINPKRVPTIETHDNDAGDRRKNESCEERGRWAVMRRERRRTKGKDKERRRNKWSVKDRG
jgi:hypothetical protein